MGLNFEQVWAALTENRWQMQETDWFLKESKAETDRQMKEFQKRMMF
jgi:hypothetical protein